MSKSPTTAPSKYARSSTKPHPPKADAWPLVSSSAYQRVPSPKSLAWAGPYASGRTHSWPTSIPTEPATGQQKPSTDIIELGRRTARGYRNTTNYQLRMLLIAGGLDTSPHPTMKSPENIPLAAPGDALLAGCSGYSSRLRRDEGRRATLRK